MPNDTPPSLLTVSDAASRLGVTPRTLKYYEERGLVTPSRSGGRYRLYDEADLERGEHHRDHELASGEPARLPVEGDEGHHRDTVRGVDRCAEDVRFR